MTSIAATYPTPFSSSSSCYPNASSSRDQLKGTGYGIQDGFHALSTPHFLRSRSHSKGMRRRSGVRCQPPSLRVICLRGSNTPAVTRRTWEDTVLKSKSPVLVEFYAKWCGPCQMVHRVIDEIATEYRGKLKCFVLDTDDNLKVAETYDIKAVPVVLLFKNCVKQGTVVGTMPKEFYVAAIEEVLTP